MCDVCVWVFGCVWVCLHYVWVKLNSSTALVVESGLSVLKWEIELVSYQEAGLSQPDLDRNRTGVFVPLVTYRRHYL